MKKQKTANSRNTASARLHELAVFFRAKLMTIAIKIGVTDFS